MNTLDLSNVVIGEELQKNIDKNNIKMVGVYEMIDPVVNRLATLNPLWTFIAVNATHGAGDTRLAAGFRVMLDGEELGTIATSYMGNRGRVIAICNDRIGKGRPVSYTHLTLPTKRIV